MSLWSAIVRVASENDQTEDSSIASIGTVGKTLQSEINIGSFLSLLACCPACFELLGESLLRALHTHE